jgi:predicted nucleic acid-binding protein
MGSSLTYYAIETRRGKADIRTRSGGNDGRARTGGARTGVLPDFFIGAHAAVSGLPLLTRDGGRYRTYFPRMALIAPEK